MGGLFKPLVEGGMVSEFHGVAKSRRTRNKSRGFKVEMVASACYADNPVEYDSLRPPSRPRRQRRQRFFGVFLIASNSGVSHPNTVIHTMP